MVRRYFGTDGIRGRANQVITPELALKVGQAAGLLFRNGEHRHRVLIGKDTRLSGYMIENALVAGFTSVGMDVLLTGPIPTPAVGMLARSMRADLGVMISASHNPFDDNGIKLFGPDGFKLSDEVELEIEKLIDSDMTKQFAKARDLGRARRIDGVQDRYIEFAKLTLPKAIELEGLRVVIDCANGAAYKVAPGALWEMGADVISIGVDPDGFNINKDCGSTDPRRALRQGARDARRYRHRARRRRRPRDDRGRARPCGRRRPVARGHRRELEGRRPPAAARRGRHRDVQSRARAPSRRPRPRARSARRSATATCSSTCASTATISAASRPATSSCPTTPPPATASSPRLQVLAVVKRSGKPVSEVCHRFEPLPQVLKNVRYRNGKPLENAAVRSAIASAEKKLGEGGRLIVRPSGTEPVIRVMGEGDDKLLVEAAVDDVVEALTEVAA